MRKEPLLIDETDDYLVLDKPAGLIVHSDGRTEEPSLADWVLAHYPALASVGEPWVSPQGKRVALPGIVHRLDRTTSGIMLLAKTRAMYAHLKEQFKARHVDKAYRAIVYGHMEKEDGRIVAEITRTGETGKKRWDARPCDAHDKRAAITEWRVISRGETDGEKFSYIDAYPKTGRTHQIRVHLSSIDHPIVADHLYATGKQPILGFTRPALHAYSIAFALPAGERVVYAAAMPSDFPKMLK